MASYELSGPVSEAVAALVVAAYQSISVTYTGGEDGPVKLATDGGVIETTSAVCNFLARSSSARSIEGSTPVAAGQVSSWVDAATTAFVSDTTFATHGRILQSLTRMGVTHSSYQCRVAKGLREGGTPFASLIDSIEKHLASNTYLVGERVTLADIYVVTTCYQLLRLSLAGAGSESFPHVARWFACITEVPEVCAVLGRFVGGVKREGGQVDLRPTPERVARDADAAIALNAGSKKAMSQRQKEKAEKKKETVEDAGPSVPATGAQPAYNTGPDLSVDEWCAMTASKLKDFDIPYVEHRHEEAKTVDDLVRICSGIDGGLCKNLFVKAKKAKQAGDSRLWLIVALHDTKTDLKEVATKLGYGKIVLRFADAATLRSNLGVVQGSVSPLCLMNDTMQVVNLALDARILEMDKVNFHPCHNAASMTMSGADLKKFIEKTGHKVHALTLPKA